MIQTLDYALMAGRAYQSTRAPINQFFVATDWLEFFHVPDIATAFNATGGFEAVSFRRASEIVISYAGTYNKDYLGDQVANVGLATGFGSTQLFQAVEYYLQVKAANPGATITLTGHSLGGGLASLVSVFFGVQAQTFDQAPFAQTALYENKIGSGLSLSHSANIYEWPAPSASNSPMRCTTSPLAVTGVRTSTMTTQTVRLGCLCWRRSASALTGRCMPTA
jgi:Lipase (class 3)